jgi:hypothetical protein
VKAAFPSGKKKAKGEKKKKEPEEGEREQKSYLTFFFLSNLSVLAKSESWKRVINICFFFSPLSLSFFPFFFFHFSYS